MGKATRIEHRWYNGLTPEDSAIIATYRVEGRDDRLFVKTLWSEPFPDETQRQEIEPWLLRMADEEAEWFAERPDDVLTAEWVCS